MSASFFCADARFAFVMTVRRCVFGRILPSFRNFAQAIKDLGRAGKAFSVGWNVIPNEIAALKNGTQIALFDQNWPQQAAFGAIACAYFFKYGKILPNTQHLTVITKANLVSAQKKLADIKTYALTGLPSK